MGVEKCHQIGHLMGGKVLLARMIFVARLGHLLHQDSYRLVSMVEGGFRGLREGDPESRVPSLVHR